MSKKARVFWPIVITILLADFATKWAAAESLPPHGPSLDVVGDLLRLTLTFNRGAALGLPAGARGKEILGVVGVVIAGILYLWYVRSRPNSTLLWVALALVFAGALGNAWERLLSPRGVVDFIDLGIGRTRFWTFNVADMATSIGAGLLALTLWRSDRSGSSPPSDASPPTEPSPPSHSA